MGLEKGRKKAAEDLAAQWAALAEKEAELSQREDEMAVLGNLFAIQA